MKHDTFDFAGKEHPRISLALCVIFLMTWTAYPSFAASGVSTSPLERWRQGGGPLPISLRNESRAAAMRAREWLLRHQASTGDWGDVRTTSLATLACLLTEGFDPTPAVDRALAHLATATVAQDAADEPEAFAWRTIALAVAGPRAPQPVPAAFLAAMTATNRLPPNIWLTVVEALQLFPQGREMQPPSLVPLKEAALEIAWLAPGPLSTESSARMGETLAGQWTSSGLRSWRTGEAWRAWRLARAINLRLGGQIVRKDNGEEAPLDWRSEMARHWIGRQRIDPLGGGFWPSVTTSPPPTDPGATLRETAYAILLLQEL